MIVGYDEEQETYSVRHPFVWQGTYAARYDEIGQTNGNEWFNVTVFDSAKSADDPALHRLALENAISFADGTRLGEHKWAQGFKAYELWLEVLESGNELPSFTHYHANILRNRRELAAQYLRDVAQIFPAARKPLESAAAHYEREHQAAERLYRLIDAGRHRGYRDEERSEATLLLRQAYDADRAAIDEIRTALAMLDR